MNYQHLLSVATPDELEELERLLKPKSIPYCPHDPSVKQRIFLDLQGTREVFYGGAAGGGKSDAILMAALEFVDQPGYAAIIFRRTFPELNIAGGLIPRSQEWLAGSDATWNGSTKTWTFPSGATLTFGHMQNEDDKYNYKSSEFHFVGFDELTSFTETQYLYLFSRNRRLKTSNIPLRMRSGSNPGDIGHEWVKKRFVAPLRPTDSRKYVPARLEDNPFLNYGEYVENLNQLDPVTRAQLLGGDWDTFEGGRFKREWFRHTFRQTANAYFVGKKEVEVAKMVCSHFTICDPAATDSNASDYTAIGAFAVTPDKQVLVLDVVRAHLAIEDIVPAIRDVALRNGSSYVGFEAVAFQWAMIHLSRRLKDMPPVRALSASVARIPIQRGQQGKLVRATPAIVKAEAGEIFLPEQAAWKDDYVTELTLFTGDDKKDAYDDQVDMTAYGVLQVNFSAAVQETKQEKPPAGYVPEDRATRAAARLTPTRESNWQRRGMFGT